MKVSVIIPVYNAEKYLIDTINSVLNQTFVDFELILIDDGSTDNSINIINEFQQKDKRIKLFYRESANKGASVCRNIGIENSTGDYIIFLDSDDLLTKNCIYNRIACMNENPILDFGIFRMGFFKNIIGDTDGCLNIIEQKQDEYLKDFLSYKLPWAITCPIWKTSFLKKNDIRFDERYQRLQDPEFHTKIMVKFNPEFKVFKETLPDCYYRLPKREIKFNKNAIENLINGFILYISDLRILNSALFLKIFFKNTLHVILFFYKLTNFTIIRKYTNHFEKQERTLSVFTIYIFFLFNRFGFTFKKGLGVSRLWQIINKK